MLMAMCMLAACSMVVSAEEETTIINYLSRDEKISGGLPAREDCFEQITNKDGNSTGMSKISSPQDLDGDGQFDVEYYFSLNTGLWGKSASGTVSYQTHAKIPAQKYLFSVWYKTDTTFAHVEFEYPGDTGKVFITLPPTGENWKQFFVVWDAAYGTTTVTTTGTDAEGNPTEIKTTYFNSPQGERTDDVFSGVYVHLLKPRTAKAQTKVYDETNYMYFCNPVLTPLTEDMVGIFETGKATDYEYSSIYYCYTDKVLNEVTGEYEDKVQYTCTSVNDEEYDLKIDKMFNVIGTKVDSVSASSEATFKFAPAALTVEEAKAQTGQVVLATYDETNGKMLTGVEIVNSTDGIGGATCTIPTAFAGKTVKAYFWGSNGSLKPLAAPVTATVAAIASEE